MKPVPKNLPPTQRFQLHAARFDSIAEFDNRVEPFFWFGTVMWVFSALLLLELGASGSVAVSLLTFIVVGLTFSLGTLLYSTVITLPALRRELKAMEKADDEITEEYLF